ncbi:MAG: bifunctional diaminohydroxyphosphoribosylaminopyrimidine deaminase/5-amino-6-(5-phosphoribosylamino)uracil reductase RibD [Flavobacteriales bacterium]
MNDNQYILRCIQLAENGLGKTYPNPMVGAVIVHQNEIIGEGWHQKTGEPHAEVHAIQSVKNTNLLKNATLYVSLEPCSHHGKTPPCSDLIIQYKIPKVVIGIQDFFAEVNGLGIQKLKNAGCEVILSSLQKECFELNKRFFTFHQKKRPYIILKWAETDDGFIDKLRKSNKPEINWITHPYSKQLVHKWRSEEQAVLIGKNTALQDNPRLNIRTWTGQNVRIIIDRNLEIPSSFNVYDQSQKTIILNQTNSKTDGLTQYIKADFKNLPEEICTILFEQNIQSVIIEGGRYTTQSFIDIGLWDEARVFISDKRFKQGIKAPSLKNQSLSLKKKIQEDDLFIYKNKSFYE